MNFKIRRLLILLLMLLGTPNGRAAGEVDFQKAVAAYEEGQYETAAQAFNDSLAKQPAAGTLLNLGLAEWQRGHAGGAVVAWEQSAWLNPFNHEARENLLYAREMGSINPLEMTWCEQASTWLPANDWAWIMSVSLWLALAMATLPGFFRARKAGWHQTLAALALGAFILSISPCIGIVTRSEIGIVVVKSTALRLTPTLAAEVVAPLSAGDPVRQLRTRGDYLFVHTQSGNGWIERRQIQFLSP